MRNVGTLVAALILALGSVAGCSCGDGGVPPGADGGDGGGMTDAPGADVPGLDAPGADVPGLDAPTSDAGAPDAFVPECTAAASECTTLYGAPPCGTWTCPGGLCVAMCAGCTTDADGDGYGVGTGCAGPDCDDADRLLGSDGVRSCYSGPAGTSGVGTCRAGTEVCAAGVLAPCSGEVFPSAEACNAEDDDCDTATDEMLGTFGCGLGACATSVAACTAGTIGMCVAPTGAANDAACNGVDDDCDGLVDEDCTCVHVASTGNDTMAVADDNTTPFATVQAAIGWAAADSTRPRIVCVASGPACGATGTFNGAVTMSDGISVLGRYESTGWTRCGNSTTVLVPGVATGVLFPASVTSPTVLGGFRVDRFAAATTAGVTVDGATNATIAEVTINNAPAASNCYGVNLINGGEATITRSTIDGGAGTAESIGVRSVGGMPTITNNCLSLDANGRCDDFCGTNPAIRGRYMPGAPAGSVAYGVLLSDSPGSIVETSAICANESDRGSGIRIDGDATGVIVRSSLVNAFGGATDSHGVWMEDCGGAAPWIVDNFMIASAGDSAVTRVDGVRAIGDCHPVIDSNVRITGGAEGGTTGANGVYCGANSAGLASSCIVVGNLAIQGSGNGFPPTAVGVRCDTGGCLRIADNVIDARGGIQTWGIYLGASGTLIERNTISGGCATMAGIGVYAEGSYARLENNFISAGTCPPGGATGATARWAGMVVASAPGPAEIDVHSNVIDGRGVNVGTCQSAGLSFVATGIAAAGPHGVFRNNVIRGGDCGMAVVVAEASPMADPRIFENNDLDPYSAPTALYFDEMTTAITTIAGVNALTDATFAANFSADASFVAYPADLHITGTSPCIGAGTAAGAPAEDYDGDVRDATAPDVGADEN